MKQLIAFLSILATLTLFQASYAEGNLAKEIQWHTNFDKAAALSQSLEKPMVLFFTGSDWCSWCKKLEKEALNTKEFANATADKFIFLKLDFPRSAQIDPALKAQNKRLQEQYQVRGFPTIVLLNAQQKPIGLTGYRAGGGSNYASHLLKMVQNHSAYREKMRRLGR